MQWRIKRNNKILSGWWFKGDKKNRIAKDVHDIARYSGFPCFNVFHPFTGC